ncbi:MAG TPA: histidine-type phosphatase [Acidobacteriaceae bacterium]|nr:histidine-type phosphatase [Acidobacteriaceae bacterium]
MVNSRITRLPFLLLCSFALACGSVVAQAAPPPSQQAQLRFVVVLTRHGVRSPTPGASQYDRYSALPWPKWNVQPGYLTPRGYALMKLFGAYDRAWLAQQGLFAASGCADTAHVTILADSDERTRETGKALAEGMFPGCPPEVHALPQGTHDPLFHAMSAGTAKSDPALETAAIRGRIGGNPANLAQAYRAQLAALENVLSGCGHAPPGAHPPLLLFNTPATLQAGTPRHPVRMRGPLEVAASLTENLLLEYTEGMPDVGWGCVDGSALRYLMQLHSADEDLKDRTPAIARFNSSYLLRHILMAMEQQVGGRRIPGSPGPPGDRLLILAGHDTNVANVAGALGLHWILDGRRDGTPPGGALLFELWRNRSSGAYFVHVDYMAQTLEQMRSVQVLTLTTPPDRVPVFVPGCGRADMSCSWQGFSAAARNALAP